jgi:hypothetical protein
VSSHSPEPPTERAVVAGGNARDPRKSTGVLAVEKVDEAREDATDLARTAIASQGDAERARIAANEKWWASVFDLARHTVNRCVWAVVVLAALAAATYIAYLGGAFEGFGFKASGKGEAPAAAASFNAHAMFDTDADGGAVEPPETP